jgi:hypothetical protein
MQCWWHVLREIMGGCVRNRIYPFSYNVQGKYFSRPGDLVQESKIFFLLGKSPMEIYGAWREKNNAVWREIQDRNGKFPVEGGASGS